MAVKAFPDEWLVQSLEGLITPELLQAAVAAVTK